MPPRRMIGRQRLGIEDVEIGRAEMALVEGGDQVGHDDERAAPGIDDPRSARQPVDASRSKRPRVCGVSGSNPTRMSLSASKLSRL